MTLTVQQLNVTVQNKTIVHDLSFSLEKGQIIGLFGPNGSGKTTAFYAIAGLYQPTSGSITLSYEKNVISTEHMPLFKKTKLGLGYLPQDRTLILELSVEENIWAVLETLDATKKQKHQLEYLIDCFGLQGVRHRLGKYLSGGERRRCELACLLAHQPTYLLLDEPFAGIDPISIKQIKSILKHLKHHHGILITDHQVIETMKMCDQVLVMRHGRLLASGSPENIQRNSEVQRVYLGEEDSI